MNTTLQVLTGLRSASPENRIQTKPLSRPDLKNILYGGINIDDNSQSFSNPIKSQCHITICQQ